MLRPAALQGGARRAAEHVFGSTVNGKGFRVLKHMSVIQGDGISYTEIGSILRAVTAAGFAAQNVAFGMGGGLLQRVHRDMLSGAIKLCHVVLADGSARYTAAVRRRGCQRAALGP